MCLHFALQYVSREWCNILKLRSPDILDLFPEILRLYMCYDICKQCYLVANFPGVEFDAAENAKLNSGRKDLVRRPRRSLIATVYCSVNGDLTTNNQTIKVVTM